MEIVILRAPPNKRFGYNEQKPPDRVLVMTLEIQPTTIFLIVVLLNFSRL